MADGEMNSCIRCDVELEVKAPADAVANKWLADALRRIADKIEEGSYEDGHHDVTDRHGKKLGEVYLDFYNEP